MASNVPSVSQTVGSNIEPSSAYDEPPEPEPEEERLGSSGRFSASSLSSQIRRVSSSHSRYEPTPR
eukprot:COSAG01_NODE_10985_length_2033_cov_2.034126_2_plen_66_part_00